MYFIAGFLAGIVPVLLILYLTMPYFGKIFFTRNESKFPFSETVDKIRNSCQEDEEWDIKQEKNFNRAYEKSGFTPLPHKLVEFKVGNPNHSHAVNTASPEVSTFMPAAIAVVEEEDDEVAIYRKNTALLGKMFPDPMRRIMGEEVPEELDRILEGIVEE
ncbi:MAG: hypothetical protein ACQEP7_06380 [bacterium]